MNERMAEHRRQSNMTWNRNQEELYDRIRETGGWDSVVVHQISSETGQAGREFEAALIKEHIDLPECLNTKREHSDRPDAVRMRTWYEQNREKWNEYNRRKQRERRARLAKENA